MTKEEMQKAINPNYKLHDVYTVEDVRRRHQGNWFSPDTMRFFSSRILGGLYAGKRLVYFVSSEKTFDDLGRRYTVRSYDPKSDTIETVDEFQGYKYSESAKARALSLAYNDR